MGRLAAGYMDALAFSLLAVWLALALTVMVRRPGLASLISAARIPLDVGHLLANLLRNRSLRYDVRVRLWAIAVCTACLPFEPRAARKASNMSTPGAISTSISSPSRQ